MSGTLKGAETCQRLKLMRDALANTLSTPVAALMGLILVPLMLKALGKESYGLWIVANSAGGMVAAVDLGLHYGVNRAVAADPAGSSAEHADFVRSAGSVFFLIGVAGWIRHRDVLLHPGALVPASAHRACTRASDRGRGRAARHWRCASAGASAARSRVRDGARIRGPAGSLLPGHGWW